MLEGVDVSYAQGNYAPSADLSFVIVNASRANIGLAVGSQYRNQVANARAAGKHVGHYFFNGNIDPVVCADYFVNNLSYQPGDSLWLDCESEPSTGTVAWGPAQAAAFNARVMSRGFPCPGTYLNRSLMDGMDWSPVVAQGSALWIAYYNPAPPPIKWWPTWTVWQYTSTPIDRNKAQASSVASLGASMIGGVFMALTDQQQSDLFDAVMNLRGYLYKGGASVASDVPGKDYDPKSVMGKLKNIENAILKGGPSMPDGGKSLAQTAADTKAAVSGLVSPQIDYKALAAEIVAQLPQGTLTKQDVVDAVNSLVLKAG